MAEQDPLPQPIDIPWQPLCVSNDMIDPTACNKKFPMPWKTSIAISGYEPDESLMPQPFCGGKLTYLKVTVTIAGYQPTDEEIKQGYTAFGNTPVETALDNIFATYFGCYGVLLNIGIFPNSTKAWNTQDFPRIIAMEPQVRELVQTSTETGEVLTHSKDETSTSTSYANAHTSKTGVSGNVKVNGTTGIGGGADTATSQNATAPTPMGWSAELGATASWENTSQDKTDTSIDGLRERSEKNSTSTTLQQLYNLLSAYHLGTNRGVFLMLPRPHMLQPTDRRTFIQGVRSIEGVQEFFLIVSRPKDMEGICVEAKLDTGHFKEDAEVKEPPVEYAQSSIDYVLERRANNIGKNSTTPLDEVFPPVPSGWYIDRRTQPPTHPLGDAGHVGISETDNGSNAQGAPKAYAYQAISDTQIKVSGYIEGGGLFGAGAIFNKKYKVYLRSIEPISPKMGSSTDIADMFTTSRNLCCCFYSGNPCLIKGKLSPGPIPPIPVEDFSHIVGQRMLTIPTSLLSEPIVNSSLEPAVKALLRKLKSSMISEREGRYSHFEDGISFLDTDFFVKSVLEYYPDTVKNTLLNSIKGISRNVTAAYGSRGTINDALSDTLADFIMKTKLDYKIAVEQRRLIGLQIKN